MNAYNKTKKEVVIEKYNFFLMKHKQQEKS